MKKNITINLFGQLYHIDEDAYELLKSYEDNMRRYFSAKEGGEEIIDDIEHRVAELLSELQTAGATAINIENVQDIIRRIGNPEQFDDNEADGECPPPAPSRQLGKQRSGHREQPPPASLPRPAGRDDWRYQLRSGPFSQY